MKEEKDLNLEGYDELNIIKDIKSEYSFSELNAFSVENGRVYVTIDNKKHVISGTGEKSATANTDGEKKEEKKPDANNLDASPDRFKNLETD